MRLNIYSYQKQNILTQIKEKEKQTMTYSMYFVMGLIIGGLIGTIITYILMHDRFTKKMQHQEIVQFIRRMRRLKGNGKVEIMERSIKQFTKKCLNFYAESFKTFKQKDYDAIADFIIIYDSQKHPYHNIQYNGMENVGAIQVFEKQIISEEEIQKNICENFRRIIG